MPIGKCTLDIQLSTAISAGKNDAKDELKLFLIDLDSIQSKICYSFDDISNQLYDSVLLLTTSTRWNFNVDLSLYE